VATAAFAILPFPRSRKRSDLCQMQVFDHQELIKQHPELLCLQSARLNLEREELEQRRLPPRFALAGSQCRALSFLPRMLALVGGGQPRKNPGYTYEATRLAINLRFRVGEVTLDKFF
jgi:hypothetical protein